MNRWKIGDVLEWAEPDWFKKGKRTPEFFKKSERLLTAQITSMDKTYVHLEVLRCEVLSDQSATGVKTPKPGQGIVRKHWTLKARGRSASRGADMTVSRRDRLSPSSRGGD